MISVVLSTRNGDATLPGLFASLARCDLPEDGYEIVVVDNGSTDSTASLLEQYSVDFPLLILSENQPGKNVALNRALAIATGDLLIFTDDDVVLPRDFLIGYDRLATTQPDFDLFGGHIVARWEVLPAQQLLEEIPLGIAFSITETDRTYGAIRAGRIYGPNMAVRRKVFDGGLQYDESIGPSGKQYVMGSETEFLQRSEASGHLAFFDPSIVVQHCVEAHQFESKWLSNRAYKAGRAMLHDQIRKGVDYRSSKRLLGMPRWAVRQYIEAELRAFFYRIGPQRRGKYAAQWRCAFLKGYLYEYKRDHISVREDPG